MVTAKVVSPCYVDGAVAEVDSVVEVDQETFDRLSQAGCLEKTSAKAREQEEEPEEKELESPKTKVIRRSPKTK